MTDRPFTHPNAGKEARIEQSGLEVRLILVCGTQALSDSLFEDIAKQLKDGALNLTMMGRPTRIVEDGVYPYKYQCGALTADEMVVTRNGETFVVRRPRQADDA